MCKLDEMVNRFQVIVIVWFLKAIKESHVSNSSLMDNIGFNPGIDTTEFKQEQKNKY
jgi:hypothetical protein